MSLGIPELLIVLVIVLLLFGTKKLKSLGTDLGGAIKGFRNALGENAKKQGQPADGTESPEAENPKVTKH